MSAETAAVGRLVAFRGPVTVRRGPGAATLLLRGRDAAAPDQRDDDYTELAFAVADAGALPAVLRDARVYGPLAGQNDPPGRLRYRIEASAGAGASTPDGWSTELLARGVQRHRGAGQAFFGAVPPPRLPFGRRCGWLLLLWVLRVPGAARVIERLRGRT
jgi:hypothetical protein